MALRNRDKIKIDAYPRMADFFHFIVAAEEAVFKTSGTFSKAIRANSKNVGKDTIEYDYFASTLTRFLRSGNGIWRGTAAQLLDKINESLSDDDREKVKRDKSWPKAPNSISLRLKELAPALRKVGYEVVQEKRRAKKRQWTLECVNQKKKRKASKNS
jgi:hypothetical protein